MRRLLRGLLRGVRRSLMALLALGTLAVAAAAALLWLLGSQGGTNLLLSRLRPRVEPALTIGRVTGSLLGGLVLEDVRLRLARDELDIARLDVEWDTVAALAGVVGFSSARVSLVEYRRLPATTTARRAATLDLPFEIRIADAVAEGLRMQNGDDVLELGRTSFGARFADGLLELDDVTSEANGIALAGSGSVRLASPVQLRAALQWSGPIGGTDGAGQLRVDGDWPVLRVHHELDAPFKAVAEGELELGSVPRADLRLEWQELKLPGLERYPSPRGRLAVAGTIESYRFDGNGTLNLDGRFSGFEIAGTGEAGLLHVAQLVLTAQTWDGEALGEIRSSGDVTLDTRTAALAVAARDLDPRWLVDGWPGRLTGTAQLNAAVEPLEARFTDVDLAGELRGYPVALRGAVTRGAPRLWQFAPLRVESGTSVLVAEGSIDDRSLALDVDADVAQLDAVVPGASGGLTADLRLGGSIDEPSASGFVEARALEVRGFEARRVRVQGQGGFTPDMPLDLTLEGDGFARGNLSADTVRAHVAGTTARHRVTAQARAPDWQASVGASGGLADGVWGGAIDALGVDLVVGAWRLEQPAAVTLAPARATLAPSCLVHESGALWCAELALTGQPDDKLVVSAQNFELATLAPLLPRELALNGVYQLSASLFDLTGSPRGALSVTGGPTLASVAFGAAQAFPLRLDEVTAGGTLSDGRLELSAMVQSGEAGRVTLGARVDDVGAADSTIGGRISVHWPDLAFLALLSPALGDVAGTVDVDLTIGGTVEEPSVDGRAAWNDGRISVPAWGLVIEQVSANATSPDGRALAFQATGKAGDGTLELTGSTALDPQAGWPTRLKLSGDSIRAVQLADAEIYASPDLDVYAELPQIRVTGTVHVPRAAIELSSLPAQAVSPSPDTVLHGQDTEAEEMRPLQLTTDLLLTFGDDVRYSGLNLATNVTGQLRLNADPGRSATATGTLTLNGTYNAYGQTLQLERGELLFSGPMDDPGLAVRAVRQIESTTGGAEPIRVGVELAGTVKAPRTRVFSTPSMSEADALSYLLLGRPVTGSGSEETATLQTAAISMGLNQALPAVQRLGETLRLDELSVQSTDTDAGALMAGKNVSPRVYIRYSYGLFNRIGGLLVRFKLNERLSLETRSGDQKSMDLLYTVEKD